jgi:tRNA A37 threonylcarbamoyladenosine dehydratase
MEVCYMDYTDVNKFEHIVTFLRTVGLVMQQQLQTLRNKRIEISGIGGVGGVHTLTIVHIGRGTL